VGGGFLIALINGISLPILFELFVMVLDIIRTGHWYGPMAIMELWFIQFVFGFGCSLLPSLAIASTLSVLLPRKIHNVRGFRMCAGVMMGAIAAILYVWLLFFLEPLMNLQKHSILAAFILVEEICIYIWIAHRWGR
jgi:hypothetical protein